MEITLSVLSDSFTLCTITSLPHVGRVATTSKQTSGARLYRLPRWRGVIPDGNSSKWYLLDTIAHIPLILNIQYSKYILTWLSTTMEYHVLFMWHFNTCHATAWKTASPEPIPCVAPGLRLSAERISQAWFFGSQISIWFPYDFHVISMWFPIW